MCVASRIFLKPRTQHHVIGITNGHGLKMIGPRTLSTTRQYTLESQGVWTISPNRQFYILVSKFCDSEVRLLKHKKNARTTEPSSIINANPTNVRKAFSIVTTKPGTQFNVNASEGIIDQQTSQQADASAVHYEVTESQNSQF